LSFYAILALSALVAICVSFTAVVLLFSSNLSHYLYLYGNLDELLHSSTGSYISYAMAATTPVSKYLNTSSLSSSSSSSISSPTSNTTTTTTTTMMASIPNEPPHVRLVYDGKKYDSMHPFIFYNGFTLKKVKLPTTPDTPDQTVLSIKPGSKISFEFDKDPKEVDAFLIDYESDVNSIIPLRKTGTNTFDITGSQGTKNLEVHAIFSKDYKDQGEYTSNTATKSSATTSSGTTGSSGASDSIYASYSSLVNVKPTGVENTKSVASLSSSSPSSSCNALGSNSVFDVSGVKGSHGDIGSGPTLGTDAVNNYNKDNDIKTSKNALPANVLDNNLNTGWSVKGKGSWILLDIGQQATAANKKATASSAVCNVEISFDKGDKVINLFTIQTSSDGIHFSQPVFYQNTGLVPGKEWYNANFDDQAIKARYIKITLLGNTQGDSYDVAEVKVLGKK
jgi:hypothetical protein